MAAASRLLTNPVAWGAVFVVGFYVLLARVTPVKPLIEFMVVAQIMVSAWAMLTVGGVAMRCFVSRGMPHPDDLVALGMFLTAFGVNWNGGWSLFYRLAGQASWIVNNDIYNAWRPIIVLGVIIKIAAIGIFGANVPRAYKIRHGTLLILLLTLVLTVYFLSPDLRPLADFLRGYLDEAVRRPGYIQNAGPI